MTKKNNTPSAALYGCSVAAELKTTPPEGQSSPVLREHELMHAVMQASLASAEETKPKSAQTQEGYSFNAEEYLIAMRQAAQSYAPSMGASFTREVAEQMQRSLEVADDEVVTKPEFLLVQDDETGLLSRGELQILKAKQKSGKTLVCLALAASVLGYEGFGFKTKEEKARVAYIDTEQGRSYISAAKKRVYELMGWTEETDAEEKNRFKAFSLRALPVEQRLLAVLLIIAAGYHFVIVDGIVDLGRDFNEVQSSKAVIDMLAQAGEHSHAAMLCVIHTNKSRDDHNARGHLGTISVQKASETYEVEKVEHEMDTHFLVTATDCRLASPHDWGFKITREGHLLPIDRGQWGETKKGLTYTRFNDALTEILTDAGDEGLKRSDLVRQLREKGYGQNQAYTLLRRALDPNTEHPIVCMSGRMVRLCTDDAAQGQRTLDGNSLFPHEEMHTITD